MERMFTNSPSFLLNLKRGFQTALTSSVILIASYPDIRFFIIQQDNRYQLLVNYKQWKDASAGTFEIIKSFSTDWLSEEMLSLRLDSSSNMDTLYESLVRQIASTQITSSQQNLHQAVFQTIQIEAIKRKWLLSERKN